MTKSIRPHIGILEYLTSLLYLCYSLRRIKRPEAMVEKATKLSVSLMTYLIEVGALGSEPVVATSMQLRFRNLFVIFSRCHHRHHHYRPRRHVIISLSEPVPPCSQLSVFAPFHRFFFLHVISSSFASFLGGAGGSGGNLPINLIGAAGSRREEDDGRGGGGGSSGGGSGEYGGEKRGMKLERLNSR